MSTQIAILGAGMMGEAIVSGVLRAGSQPSDITIAEPRDERREQICRRYQVNSAPPEDAVRTADVVFVVTKPADVSQALQQISPSLPKDAVVVSLAAGVPLATLTAGLPQGTAVVRAMPNTPATLGKGVTAISPAPTCSAQQAELVRGILAGAGTVVELPERYQDAATAVSGSGPAYVFYVAEAMIEAAVGLGLPRATATEMVTGTLAGAAEMLSNGGHPAMLREQVTSPGGTTIAALQQLDAHGVRAAFAAALVAARDRSAQLSQ